MKDLTKSQLLQLVVLAAGLLLIPNALRAQVNQLEIDVRAKIADKPFGKSNLKEAPEHGKVYAILAVQLISNEQKMVRPVDANMLKGLVRHELDTHGFRQVVKGQNPEILITVQYGRAWLWNPYYGDEQVMYISDPPQRHISLASHVSPRQTVTGFEGKAQSAEREKLCIKLTAWHYTTDPKAKAKQLWSTTIVVDDPDHRDLNAIAEEMLKAGAPYFDKEIKEEEVAVYKRLPDGHVKVGTPEVVDPSKTK
jgi:hypothetical protein